MLVMTGFRNICHSIVSRACSFLKFADGQTQRFRMFPYIEKKGRADEYGSSAGAGVGVGND